MTKAEQRDPAKRRFCDDPGAKVLMCSACRHRIPMTAKCTAFPNGIPKALTERGEHDTPFPGDNGIRFEPKE